MQKNKHGCHGSWFDFGAADSEKGVVRKPVEDSHEGTIHSGPARYEGMGYRDEYAADHLN